MPVSIDCAFLDVKLDSSISTNARLYHQRCKLFTWASPMVPLLKCVAFMFAKRICLNTFSISRILNYWNIFNINYFKWALTETIYGSYMAYWLHDRALTWIYGWTVSTKQGFLEEFLSPCSDSHDIIVLVFKYRTAWRHKDHRDHLLIFNLALRTEISPDSQKPLMILCKVNAKIFQVFKILCWRTLFWKCSRVCRCRWTLARLLFILVYSK